MKLLCYETVMKHTVMKHLLVAYNYCCVCYVQHETIKYIYLYALLTILNTNIIYLSFVSVYVLYS